MNRNPGFASQIRLGREGFGEHLFHKILQTAEAMTPENVSELSAKVRVWQWAAVRCAPRLFSERVAVAEIAAPAVSASNVQINNIDMTSMTTEELLELRRLLAKTKVVARSWGKCMAKNEFDTQTLEIQFTTTPLQAILNVIYRRKYTAA
jgi:hypothetical protein